MAIHLYLLIAASSIGSCSTLSVLPQGAINTIDKGGIAAVPDFLGSSEVSRLRSDASNLYGDGRFIVNALAGYGNKAGTKDKSNFKSSKDRAVLPAYIPSQKRNGQFVDGIYAWIK